MISAIIPAYNEEKCIAEYSLRLVKALNATGMKWEIYFMIGGNDNTWYELFDVFDHDFPNIHLIDTGEMGLGTKMQKGFTLVNDKARYVLTMDSDLQQLPEQLPRLLEPYRVGIWVHCVIGRHGRLIDRRSWFKRKMSGFANWTLSNYYHLGVSDLTSNYRLYSAEAIRAIRNDLVSKNFSIQPEILIRMKRAGYGSFIETDIDFPARATGVSKLSMSKQLEGYLKLLRMK